MRAVYIINAIFVPSNVKIRPYYIFTCHRRLCLIVAAQLEIIAAVRSLGKLHNAKAIFILVKIIVSAIQIGGRDYVSLHYGMKHPGIVFLELLDAFYQFRSSLVDKIAITG